jgi:hypothetical protein
MSRMAKITPLREVKKAAILSAVTKLKGEIPLAAQALGVGTTTLYRKLRQYGVLVRQNRKTGEKRLTARSVAAARFLRAVKRKMVKVRDA